VGSICIGVGIAMATARTFSVALLTHEQETGYTFVRGQFAHGIFHFNEAHGGDRVIQYIMRGLTSLNEEEFWVAPVFDSTLAYYTGGKGPLHDLVFLQRF
jgi:hypothetical protein